MCGLCGLLSEDAHWASRLDGHPVGSLSTGMAQSANPVLRRLARGRRITFINRMLVARRIRVTDWRGSHYQVTGPTGKTSLAANISQIWLAVERVTGRPFDPLQDD